MISYFDQLLTYNEKTHVKMSSLLNEVNGPNATHLFRVVLADDLSSLAVDVEKETCQIINSFKTVPSSHHLTNLTGRLFCIAIKRASE